MAGGSAGGLRAWRGTFRDATMRRLMVMSFVDSVGTALYVAGSVVYFTQKVGLSAAEVGLGLSVASIVGLLGVMPSGWVAQRVGTRPTLLVFHLWRAAALASCVFVQSFPFFLLVVCLLSIPEQAFNPLIQHFVEQVVGPEQRTATMGKIKTVYNVGFTVGAPLSGLAVKFNTAAGYDAIMLGDALTYIVVVVMLARFRGVGHAERRAETDQKPKKRGLSTDALRDRRYRGAAIVNSVMSLHLSILAVGIPLWVTLHTKLPRYSLGLLFAVNTALVILLQVPTNALATSVTKSMRLMRATGLALVMCCLLLASAAALPLGTALAALFVAIILVTVAELAQSAAGWTLAYELAPETARAEWLSTFWMGISAQFVVGPLLLSSVVIAHGSVGWVGLAVALGAFTVWTFALQRRVFRAPWRVSSDWAAVPTVSRHRPRPGRHRYPQSTVPPRPLRPTHGVASPPGVPAPGMAPAGAFLDPSARRDHAPPVRQQGPAHAGGHWQPDGSPPVHRAAGGSSVPWWNASTDEASASATVH
jgi:MFS family permease